jgi:hypothetical protein
MTVVRKLDISKARGFVLRYIKFDLVESLNLF